MFKVKVYTCNIFSCRRVILAMEEEREEISLWLLFLHSRLLFLYCFYFNFCLELMLNLITGDLNLVNINVWFLWFNKNSSIKKLNIDIKCQKEIIFFKNCLSSTVSFNWISFPFFVFRFVRNSTFIVTAYYDWKFWKTVDPKI